MASRARTGLGIGLCLAVVLTAAGCSPSSRAHGGSRPTRASSRGSTAVATASTSATGPTAVIPSTPAGHQLSWLLAVSAGLPIDPATVNQHLDAAFLAQVPPAKLNQILAAVTPSGGLRVTSITSTTPTALAAVVASSQGPLQISLSTGPDGKISGLLAQPVSTPVTAPTSWTGLDQRLAALAPQVAMLTAQVGTDGADPTCTTVHALHATTAGPLGSMFKLYVLGALATAIDAGHLRWAQPLTITSTIKSLPDGVLQNQPDGSTVTVQDAAGKMISISDNTAADLLAATVGRNQVEAMQHTFGSTDAGRNVPFLNTRELFVLKGADYPKYADAYLARDPAARLAYLTNTVDHVPLSTVHIWSQPRDISTLEWFASPQDLCQAFAGLASMARTPALAPLWGIMSANDGGLHLNPTTWPSVWFKGGSEPGVLTLGWLARTADGRTYATVLMTANPDTALDDGTATQQLLALARGSFTLAAG